ncbi:hypothetical protein [Flaviflexus equikiangi]|uniref:PD-(D/E)XK nuclease superfamily protein n=1 Tax=Flaviflexus equikiangi TaxID=2758573 RepID=A0ABS2THA0_9ACTO|nr:hypothetical protein [Flaviflexus equikiangi]MBM9433672.1 hypothetical protein [Flaviflexus equikiangi]
MQTHYFQRYHSKENVHTANATLLFARIYNHSPKSFFSFLESELLENESDLNVSFGLQERGPESVPDAVIGQPSFKIIIEAKNRSPFKEKQLEGHLKAFGIEDHRVLITLDTASPSRDVQKMIDRVVSPANQERAQREPPMIHPISHKHLRFRDLIERLAPYIDERDVALAEMFEDYKNYSHESNLIDNSDWIMLSVIPRKTYEVCRTFDLYFDVARNTKTYEGQRYLGLYIDKVLKAVGTVEKLVTVSLNENGTARFEPVDPRETVTTDEIRRIDAAIRSAKVFGDTTIEVQPYVFTLVDKFEDTEVIKNSKGAAFQRWKYSDTWKLIDTFWEKKKPETPLTTLELANFLYGKTWEEFLHGNM